MSKRPSFVPSGWIITPLKEICKRRSEPFDPSIDHATKPYIGLEHIASELHVLLGVGVSYETVSLKAKFYKGDILYGKLRPYLNKVIQAKFDGVCSTEILPIQPKLEDDSNFVYLALQGKRYLDYAESMTAGTQHPRIGWRDIARYDIAIPKNHIEKLNIAACFTTMERSIQATQASIAAAQKLKHALMQNLLTGKLKPDGTWRHDDEFDIDPKFGRIPKGWEMARVKDKFTSGRGRVINHEDIALAPGPYPVYSSQTSQNGVIGTVGFFEFEGEYITWTTDGANAGKVFFRSGRFCCTNVCGTLKGKAKVSHAYFALAIDRVATRHVAVVGNNKLMNNVMGNIRVLAPRNPDEQAAIADSILSIDHMVNQKNGVLARKSRLKGALMQNLLTGKVRIPPNLIIE